MANYNVIGVMSGTSLDGLDIAFCTFNKANGWSGRIRKATTVPFTAEWKNRLNKLIDANARELALCNVDLGYYIGKNIKSFMQDHDLKPELIASHGHTVFHQPDRRLTLQIGDGNAIFSETGIPVVYDFRSLDVALGGQGAPLVPIGDELLFGEYDYCLNLGGFANISYKDKNTRLAFDICPANMILNNLASRLGYTFDNKGELASDGEVDIELLTNLANMEYYSKKGVKSLGREWFEEMFLPFFLKSETGLKDQLRTAVEHIAMMIARAIPPDSSAKLLVTGGGALNDFLVSRIKKHCDLQVVIPDRNVVEFKEALIFAFLGLLRLQDQVNCLASVTGARRDSSAGILIQ